MKGEVIVADTTGKLPIEDPLVIVFLNAYCADLAEEDAMVPWIYIWLVDWRLLLYFYLKSLTVLVIEEAFFIITHFFFAYRERESSLINLANAVLISSIVVDVNDAKLYFNRMVKSNWLSDTQVLEVVK